MSFIKRIINEEIYKRLLVCESQESKSQEKAKKLAIQNGLSHERAEQFVRIYLRHSITNLRHKDAAKFTLGCARLFFEKQFTDAKAINTLNSIVGLIAKKYYNNFDQNLNGLSLQELSDKFLTELNDIQQKDREEVGKKEYNNTEYDIIPINSFEDAQKYYKYLYKESPWCVTCSKNMWDTYTSNGTNQVYFCLKNGFENIKAPQEDGNPKDEYGLSMISVIVNENGDLKYSTTRWNHSNKADGDHDLTAQEISDIVGVNFYKAFKPSNIFNQNLEELLKRVENGENPKIVFNSYYQQSGDMFLIRFKNKFNYIDKNGNLLSKQWFDKMGYFIDGLSLVVNSEKYNFINKNGKYLSNEWFDYCDGFINGLARIKIDEKYNFIDKNCNFLSKNGFEYSSNFIYGKQSEPLSLICINNKKAYINTNGNNISDMWFDYCNRFKENFAVVGLGKKFNFIDEDGKFLSKEWFDKCNDFSSGAAKVWLNEKINFINKKGNLISKKWFDKASEFRNNSFAVVSINNKWNVIGLNGRYVSNYWFDTIDEYIIDVYGYIGDTPYKINLKNGEISKVNEGINRMINNIITEEINKVSDIIKAEKGINRHPSDAQKSAGNYKMGHIRLNGFDITIENPKGSYRYWTDENGKKGKTLINNHYGYFTKTLGKDGDQVDVFIGSKIKSEKIFVVDQNNSKGEFDESKVMLGFDNIKDAKKAYMSNYSKGWTGFRNITEVDIPLFKSWLYNGRKQQKPFSEYRFIKNKIDESKSKKSALEKFCNKHGIIQKKIGLGFSEKEQKWYGWSHRAIYGFGIGSKVKKGDCAYNGKEWTAKTLKDAKKMAEDFSKSVS